jgi:hypothetical protein
MGQYKASEGILYSRFLDQVVRLSIQALEPSKHSTSFCNPPPYPEDVSLTATARPNIPMTSIRLRYQTGVSSQVPHPLSTSGHSPRCSKRQATQHPMSPRPSQPINTFLFQRTPRGLVQHHTRKFHVSHKAVQLLKPRDTEDTLGTRTTFSKALNEKPGQDMKDAIVSDSGMTELYI